MRKLTLTILALCLSTAASAAQTKLSIASVGNEMKWDKSTLEVPAGADVVLTIKNNGTTDAMQHNWVLVKPGTENDVGAAGAAAGEKKDYVPEGNPNILAHSKLTKPGKTTTLKFKAPAQPGDYTYICTYPGHYVFMKGTLKVK